MVKKVRWTFFELFIFRQGEVNEQKSGKTDYTGAGIYRSNSYV